MNRVVDLVLKLAVGNYLPRFIITEMRTGVNIPSPQRNLIESFNSFFKWHRNMCIDVVDNVGASTPLKRKCYRLLITVIVQSRRNVIQGIIEGNGYC